MVAPNQRFRRVGVYEWDDLLKDLRDFQAEVDSITGGGGGGSGTPNTPTVIAGQPGLDGKSAYQLAIIAGFEGTEEEWLASLQGQSAYDLAVLVGGFEGSEEEWLASLQGLSAYQVAVQNGFLGTEEEWLISLRAASNPDDYGVVDMDYGFTIEVVDSLEDYGTVS